MSIMVDTCGNIVGVGILKPQGRHQGQTFKSLHLHFYFIERVATGTIEKFSASTIEIDRSNIFGMTILHCLIIFHLLSSLRLATTPFETFLELCQIVSQRRLIQLSKQSFSQVPFSEK